MATTREQRVMDAARALVLDQEKGCQLTPSLLALEDAVLAAADATRPTPMGDALGLAADGWRVALRSGDEIAVDVANAFDGTALADCTTAEQVDYMRATARLHEGAAPATAEGRCDGNPDGDSVVGYVAAELLMRKYDVAEILAPGEVSRATLLRHIATEPARVAAAVAASRDRAVAALRARAESTRRYADTARSRGDHAGERRDQRDAAEADACAAIVGNVALAAPAQGGG